MTSLRKANLPRYVMLGLLLCVGSTSALARDVRLQGPNGNGGSRGRIGRASAAIAIGALQADIARQGAGGPDA